MNFEQLRDEVIDDLDAGISIELISPPGLGKSEFVRQLVGHLSKRDGERWGFAVMFLATQTPPDLIGYQFKGTREWNGREVAVTDPTLPLWMVTEEGNPVWAYKRGVLFLDEYGQGEADVKRASAELLLNHRIGPWRLPDGWGVIAASNRASDRSGVTKSFDFVINRRKEYHISPDVAAWTKWAVANEVMPITIAFANQNPHIVFSGDIPEKQGPWCTPRSLVMLDASLRIKARRHGSIPDDGVAVESARGLVGDAAAAQYFAFVKLDREMPPFEKIIADPKGVRVPEKPDAQMLVCYNLAHRVTTDTAAPVIAFMERLPKEFAVTFAKAAVNRDWKLATAPAFSKWTMANSALIAAIAR